MSPPTKRDANDILQEEGDDGVRRAFDEAAEAERLRQLNGGDEEPLPWPEPPPQAEPPLPQLKMFSKAEFVEGFVPPDYVIVGILQRRYIYSLTGQTSHAKTAIGLLIAELVGSITPATVILSYKVKKGNVFYLVGENPDDVRMREIGSDHKRRLSGDQNVLEDNITFIPSVFNIRERMPELIAKAKEVGGVSLVLVDTGAAYFPGEDDISNVQAGNYARALRLLTTLPGGPCVLVLCHPIKHVTDPSQLLPRGGGAFVNEMDGNLTAWKRPDGLVELHHGKMRGGGFEPIYFRMDKFNDVPALVDTDGNQIWSVRAVPITGQQEEEQARKAENERDDLLLAMSRNPDASQSDLARACDWFRDGAPLKRRVQTLQDALAKEKLVTKKGKGYQLTKRGKDVVDDILKEAAARELDKRRHPD